jgi:ABC-type transport system involved in multi-copper enzyme maturation permease subunit
MLTTLINKELRAIILSPKFTGTFAVCSLLILLSVFTGIREYNAMVDRYDSASQLVDQELRQETSWGGMSTRAYRAPDPMQIFVAGLDYDIGRWSHVSNESPVKLKNSAYSDDPIFAVFRFIDFAFIVQFVLTLFAILFTFDAVNGERENGTLRLVFSNAVSRANYLIAKCIGAWLGLVVPIIIPIMLGIMLIMIFGVPLTWFHWVRIYTLMGLAVLLFTFFVVLGVFISSLTRRSSVSFLLSLVVWVIFIMIVPRAGVMAAGNIVNVPRVAEIEGQVSGFTKEKWEEFYRDSEKRWAEYKGSGGTDGELNDEMMWSMMEIEDSARKVLEKEIDEYDLKLREDLKQRKLYQENMGFNLARFSPASAFQLGAMSLAGTDIEVKTRYEDAMNNYRKDFCEVIDRKEKETGNSGRTMMAFTIDESGESKMSISDGRKKETLDISELPLFKAPVVAYAEAFSPVIVDIGLLVLYIFLAFMGAFIAFVKYDVR